MKPNNKLVRTQLEAALKRFRPLRNAATPSKGWIRAIRNALGMSGRQLADRVGVTKQQIAMVEKQELAGTPSLKTMRRIAERLDCVFVYGFVPRTSLEDTVGRQAKRLAAKRLDRAAQTMSLENQSLKARDNETILAEMTQELRDKPPANLWDD